MLIKAESKVYLSELLLAMGNNFMALQTRIVNNRLIIVLKAQLHTFFLIELFVQTENFIHKLAVFITFYYFQITMRVLIFLSLIYLVNADVFSSVSIKISFKIYVNFRSQKKLRTSLPVL
jgi:hypothetical protein